jgi:GcrA cell cycle regulator
MGWTDERVERLTTLWRDGLSASQVAQQLGGVTRNAVIGKVHRLGLSGREAPSSPRRVGRPPRFPRAARAVRRPARHCAPPLPKIAARTPAWMVDEAPGTATLLTLGAHMCKWPIGDPKADGFTFCGRGAAGEGPYCGDHAGVAFRPGKPSERASDLIRSLRRYLV